MQGWFLLEALKGKSVSLHFSASSGYLYSLAYGSSLHLQSILLQSLLLSSHCLDFSDSDSFIPLLRITVIIPGLLLLLSTSSQ